MTEPSEPQSTGHRLREHFTPFRIGVVSIIFVGVLVSATTGITILPFLAAGMLLLAYGRSQGWRF